MTIVFDSAALGKTDQAKEDLARGAGLWRLWGAMGWNDIRHRYSRSVLGPFWLTLSMAALAASLSIVYSTLFRLDVSSYLAFLSLGLPIWGFIASALNEGCQCFLEVEGLIKQVRLPFTVHVLRLVWRTLIIFGHNIVIFALIALGLGLNPGTVGFLALPGLALLLVNAGWMVLLLGMACARFRDVPPIVASLTQLLFLVTPVMWRPELIADRAFIVTLNPVHHLIEIVRAPLLGAAPAWESWVAAVLCAAAGWALTFSLFARFRSRIAYWL